MLALKFEVGNSIALKGKHALDAFAWVEFKNIITGVINQILKTMGWTKCIACEKAGIEKRAKTGY